METYCATPAHYAGIYYVTPGKKAVSACVSLLGTVAGMAVYSVRYVSLLRLAD